MANVTIAGEDPWYNYFKKDPPESRWLLAAFGVRALWAVMGVLSNVAIVYITAVSKQLRGTCNRLIALESFFAIPQDASYLVSFFVFASGTKFIAFRHCFPILIGPGLSGGNAQLVMLLTGVDRLLCILFPIWYKKRNHNLYLLFFCIAVALFTGYGFVIKYNGFLENQEIMMSCSTHDMLAGSLATLISTQSMVMSCTLMALYTAIWFLGFFLRSTAKTVSERNKNILKALGCIIGLNMIGVFFKELMVFLFANFWQVSIFVKGSFTIGMSFLTIAVYSANAPVLYLFSSLYREQFKEKFKFLPRFFNTATSPTLFLTTNVGQQEQLPPQQQQQSGNNGFEIHRHRIPSGVVSRCLPNRVN